MGRNFTSAKLSRLFFPVVLSLWAVTGLQAQISGTVFRDYDGDGVKDTGEPGVAGVAVSAYINGAPDALLTSGTSGTGGTYSLTVPGGQAVRLEFVIPTSGVCAVDGDFDFSSLNGSIYGTSVQFVTAPAANVNFAINNPQDYTGTSPNPMAYVTCFVNGDPLPPGSPAGTGDALVGVPYNASGTTPAATHIATAAKIGSTWGVVYSPYANKLLFLQYFVATWAWARLDRVVSICWILVAWIW